MEALKTWVLIVTVALTQTLVDNPLPPALEPVIEATVGDDVNITFKVPQSPTETITIHTSRTKEIVAACYIDQKPKCDVEDGYRDKSNSSHFVVNIPNVQEKHSDRYISHYIPYESSAIPESINLSVKTKKNVSEQITKVMTLNENVLEQITKVMTLNETSRKETENAARLMRENEVLNNTIIMLWTALAVVGFIAVVGPVIEYNFHLCEKIHSKIKSIYNQLTGAAAHRPQTPNGHVITKELESSNSNDTQITLAVEATEESPIAPAEISAPFTETPIPPERVRVEDPIPFTETLIPPEGGRAETPTPFTETLIPPEGGRAETPTSFTDTLIPPEGGRAETPTSFTETLIPPKGGRAETPIPPAEPAVQLQQNILCNSSVTAVESNDPFELAQDEYHAQAIRPDSDENNFDPLLANLQLDKYDDFAQASENKPLMSG